ncbi:MAG TPA: hypothetical protein VHZ96_09350 [Frankiaceae bacterium]|nr:hypothetical protein [Frankiaceae bacterium]
MDETIPQVDGLRLLARADAAEWVGRGEVWRARLTGGLAGPQGTRLPADLPGIGECWVRLLRMPVDDTLRARALTVAGDLLALADPGLVPIRSVRKAYDGIALVYGHLPTPATGLHLLARRRLLSAGEVVTLGVALCWALAHAHDAGIAHGRLADADVLIGPDGRPVLTGVGVRGVLGAPGEAAADIRALERMLASLLDPVSAGAPRVAEALAASSCNAAGLAALLAASTQAEPLRVDEQPSEPAEERIRRRRPRLMPRRANPRMLTAGVGAVLIGGLAGGVGWASAPGPQPQSAVLPPAARTAGHQPIDWRAVLTKLDLARSAAFGRPGSVGLDGVDVPGSPASRYDAAAVVSLRARDAHAVGLRLELGSVRIESAAPGRVTLRVTDRRMPYEIRDSHGKIVSRVAGRAAAAHLIELDASSAGAWRFATVSEPAVTS